MEIRLNRYQPNEHMASHVDGQPKLSIVLSGGLGECFGARQTSAGPGDFVLKGAFAEHTTTIGNVQTQIMSITLPQKISGLAEEQWCWRQSPEALKQSFMLWSGYLQQGRQMTQALEDQVVDLLSWEAQSKRHDPPAWLNSIKQHLDQSHYESTAALAEQVGCHPVYLARVFRRSFGVSISAYAAHRRVNRAMPLLLDKQLPLNQLALDAGYYDQSHFSREFKRLTGLTPGAYRKAIA